MHTMSRHCTLSLKALAFAFIVSSSASAWLHADTRKVSVESLIYDLKHPDAIRRQTAVKELGAVRYRPAIEQLLPLANDPIAAVRRELELSLERMEDGAALPAFITLASDVEADIRARAVAAVVNVYVPHSIGVTLANIRERLALESSGDLATIVEPDVVVDATSIETLQARLGDSDRGIRRTAIRGLGILRAKSAVPDLLRVVREDRDEGLRLDGVRALRKIGDVSIAGQLLALLNKIGRASCRERV